MSCVSRCGVYVSQKLTTCDWSADDLSPEICLENFAAFLIGTRPHSTQLLCKCVVVLLSTVTSAENATCCRRKPRPPPRYSRVISYLFFVSRPFCPRARPSPSTSPCGKLCGTVSRVSLWQSCRLFLFHFCRRSATEAWREMMQQIALW